MRLSNLEVPPRNATTAKGANEMTATTMGKATETPPAQEDEGDVTTVKCFKRWRRAVAQLGSLLELNQQEVVDRYQRFLEDDLLREIAKRQAELRKQRPGSA